MLALPKSPVPIPRGQIVRFAILGTVLAALVYILAFWKDSGAETGDLPETLPPVRIEVPELDPAVMARIKDGTREERLTIAAEPLSFLLRTALNVNSEEAAKALGMPDQPIPPADVRAAPDHMRGRWLWYKGRLEALEGPRQGHPVEGYSIYECTVVLEDGERVLFACSFPPGEGVQKGGYVRIEGFLMMLRDTTFPRPIEQAPLLIGRQMQRAYADWPAVAELDPDLLARVDDGSVVDGEYLPTAGASLGLFEEEREPLWHLGAFALHERELHTKAEWRRLPTINSTEVWMDIKLGRVERGTPMRILGAFVGRLSGRQAAPNPAGIKYWSQVLVQVRDLGGKIIPVWVPDRVDQLQPLDGLEVRGYYFKRYVYETLKGSQVLTPVFVAGRIDRYEFDRDPMFVTLGIALAAGVTLLVVWIFFQQRAERRGSLEVQNQIIERRKKRRQKLAAAGGGSSAPTP